MLEIHPNPFNPDTYVDYSIAAQARAALKIYSVEGRLLRTLVDRVIEPGKYRAYWDGTDQHGQPAASGIYFCRMTTGDFSATRKMVLLK